jgi:ElaB/YqjD/DUF883 family membrane-anchored ribosome-binding protein
MSETVNVADSVVAQEAFASELAPEQTTKAVAENAFIQVNEKGYSEEDLKRVREQEKSKLYPQIDSLKEEINLLKKDREERLAESSRISEEKDVEARKRAESEMDVRSLLEIKEKEWAEKFETEKSERERAFTLLERERQYSELSTYRNRRLDEERDNIIPELVDLISGNNADEIEQSITGLRERSSKILDSAQQALQSVRRDMKGTSTTLPPTMENNSDQQQFTAEQISAMSVTEYAKHRDRLFPGSRNQNKGIFG